jgi:hypothetical protein
MDKRKTGKDPIYGIWAKMRARCLSPTDPAYAAYGGRGITVDSAWSDFHKFKADMGPRPDGYTLDRINNDGPYSPGNCRWASAQEQANNRRSNYFIEFEGRRMTIADWARAKGMRVNTLNMRIFGRKWPIARALERPVGRKGWYPSFD